MPVPAQMISLNWYKKHWSMQRFALRTGGTGGPPGEGVFECSATLVLQAVH
mgnify:CR=1 FL=1